MSLPMAAFYYVPFNDVIINNMHIKYGNFSSFLVYSTFNLNIIMNKAVLKLKYFIMLKFASH